MLTDIAPPVVGTLAVQWQLTSPRPPPLPVVAIVDANHKVAGSLVLIFREDVGSQVSVGVTNGAVIDEAKPSHDIGHISDFALATALASTGAYLRSTRTLTAVDWVAIPLVEMGVLAEETASLRHQAIAEGRQRKNLLGTIWRSVL